MRLQKPELDQTTAGTLRTDDCVLNAALCLPESFGMIHVGETFTAYLGALNVCAPAVPASIDGGTGQQQPSPPTVVTNLTVSAQLQTPSHRYQLSAPTFEDCQARGGIDLLPQEGIDAIVSQAVTEAGQHILRVEVGYGGDDRGSKPQSLRKFYRFQVTNPLRLSPPTVFRVGGALCFVAMTIHNTGTYETSGGLTLTAVVLEPSATVFHSTQQCRLIAERIEEAITTRNPNPKKTSTNESQVHHHNTAQTTTTGTTTSSHYQHRRRGLELFDASGRLEPGDAQRYLFKLTVVNVEAETPASHSPSPSSASSNRGLAVGDELGTVLFTWKKACGETGQIRSPTIVCPALSRPTKTTTAAASGCVVHRKAGTGPSGLVLDVAKHATMTRHTAKTRVPTLQPTTTTTTNERHLPMTVAPMNAPTEMKLGAAYDIAFLVTNHTDQYITPQLQFRSALSDTSEQPHPNSLMVEERNDAGFAVCGPSYTNMEEIAGNGASATITVRFVPLTTGFVTLRGCCLMNLATGTVIVQPPLLTTLVVD